MEGQGAYNRHSYRQADSGAVAVPLLQQAAHLIDPAPDDQLLLIADYGSSQGRNSLGPLRAAIAVLRERFGGDRAICVAHTDLPDNDFSTLFHMLHTDFLAAISMATRTCMPAPSAVRFTKACTAASSGLIGVVCKCCPLAELHRRPSFRTLLVVACYRLGSSGVRGPVRTRLADISIAPRARVAPKRSTSGGSGRT